MASTHPEPLRLTEWERDVLHAALMIQVERHRDQPDKAERWRYIDNRFTAGVPIAFWTDTPTGALERAEREDRRIRAQRLNP